MSKENWDRIELIVDSALDLPASERKSYVKKACLGDEKLLANVTTMLQSIEESEGWLDDPKTYKSEFYEEISDDLEDITEANSLSGQQVGSYTVKQLIDRGGMGEVYLAERSDGEFEHQVAIKIIRTNNATEQNLKLFMKERDILAGLNHPRIARLFDGGVTQNGFPYVIMEYVDGIPINTYCKQNDCSITAKIELFCQVLEAVRYAHENLIIHCDLKPDNILVDEAGNIKILDFGISKLIEQQDGERTGNETPDPNYLTPRYAAPEQLTKQKITIRSDLYALGVIFYSLLCNNYPYNFDGFSEEEIKGTIVYQKPVRPSEKAENTQVKKKLNGDLDAMVLKAMHKDPKKRYRTAAEFLEDLNNYRQELPVSAVNNSVAYLSKKFIQRHQRGVAIFVAVLATVIALSSYYTWRITQERDQARLEAEKAERISDFLVGLFEASEPAETKGEPVPVQSILKEGTQKIDELDDQPHIKSRMLQTVATVYTNLGNYKEAEQLFKEALDLKSELYGGKSLEAADVHNQLGVLYHKKHETQKAKPHYITALDIREKELPENDLKLAQIYSDYGALLRFTGNLDSAEVLYNKALSIRDDKLDSNSVDIATSLNNIAVLYKEQGNLKQAEKFYLRALEIRISNHGELHPRVANTFNNLAVLYRDMGNFEQSSDYFEKTIDVRTKLYGINHAKTAQAFNNYAGLLSDNDKLGRAEEYYRQALAIRKEVFGEQHVNTGTSHNNLANVLQNKGKLDSALVGYMNALDIYKNYFGERHQYVGIVLSNLGRTHTLSGNYLKAEEAFNNAESIISEKYDEKNTRLASVYYDKAKLEIERGNPEQASELLEESLSIRKKFLGSDHFLIKENTQILAKTLQQTGDDRKADSLLSGLSNQ
jgi:serine/threonine-protein kinase